MITTKEDLCEWKKRAAQCPVGRVTLDLEADSLHRYQEKLCLIQYADAEGCVLIDPLAIEDMSLFAHWLRSQRIWMHGADYDMSLFTKAFRCMPAEIWDTQIAARLVGHRRFGLGNLVEHYFGVALSKSSQKADWAKRPLSPTMLEYAANDVYYMLDMADKLTAELEALGRWEWFIESCCVSQQRFLERSSEDSTRESWRIQGSGKLDRRGLAALRAFWQWRDEEAKSWDRPSFMVCGNADLLLWSQLFQSDKYICFSPRFTKGRRHRLQLALEALEEMEPSLYPEKIRLPKRRRDDAFDEKVNVLLALRDSKAEALNLEPSVLASRAMLEELVRNPETGADQLMLWQRQVMGL